MVVVAMLLGFMGYILVLNLIQVLRIPLDYVTMSFALWNFAATGLVSVFWKGPMWLQQVYLTVMSSLMVKDSSREKMLWYWIRLDTISHTTSLFLYARRTPLGFFADLTRRMDDLDASGALGCLG